MLKSLELVGFKSFADRTVFEFSRGITGVIGPNGSGKSNVVDAIKWALGEQSAKSLRGGEMTDVIFTGSASRKSLGMAEVGLVFDNGKRQFASDADEVRIVRRVYRSGEGEYLLNGDGCRLKDIKDVLLGSGAGTDAYSIIEQGRVDQLLQTAPRERRTIFEEAAGISRFRARKAEALRRLERVAGNMERLQDILDEVEKQLRTAQLQAAKATQHQHHTARLRELRIGLSLREYHVIANRLASEMAELEALRSSLKQQADSADGGERELMEVEGQLGELEPAITQVELELKSTREQIASLSARRDGDLSYLEGAEREVSVLRSRLADLMLEVRGLEGACRHGVREVADARRLNEVATDTTRMLEEQQTALNLRLAELAREAVDLKADHLERMRIAARLSNDAVGHETDLNNALRARARLQVESEQAAESLASLDGELEELTSADQSLQRRLEVVREKLGRLRRERVEQERKREELLRQAGELKATRAERAGRVEVLEELERSHEGLGTGVREVLGHLQESDPGAWRTVVGLVAEVFTVRREFAPLIDLALGERAQRFLVRDPTALAEALRARGQPMSGRVSFLHLTPTVPQLYGEEALDDPCIVALAEDVVRCDPAFAGLPRLLLGQTVIVQDLPSALSLSPRLPGWRLITLSGEVVEADGTLTVGTHRTESGILSRRSELAELREAITLLDQEGQELERRQAEARDRAGELADAAGHVESEEEVLAAQSSDMQSRVRLRRERREDFSVKVTLSRSEMAGVEQEVARLRGLWEQARQGLEEAETQAVAVKARLERVEREARAIEINREEHQRQTTEAKESLARVEERLKALRSRLGQMDEARGARQAEAERATTRLEEQLTRVLTTEAALLRCSSSLADLYSRKEASERCLIEGQDLRVQLRARRQGLLERVQTSRSAWQGQQEAAHRRELSVSKLEDIRQKLCERLRDDYQVELESLYRERVDNGESAFDVPHGVNEDGVPVEPEAEIKELQRRLSRLGSVNLDALEELAELEARYSGLRLQYDDLAEARASLEGTIHRINTDCRRMFTETFEAIRGQFVELFRKLFGGGMADILLEEGVDILESGIEIVARPPGKELRSISLMSGGEKTMTAVALLLSIFRSKPSPFCILDEVDAALDEANVGRFTGVLREFASQSQFILITHHQRTMAAADVLWGVTMAEAGVSSRYSVRFEDYVAEERRAA